MAFGSAFADYLVAFVRLDLVNLFLDVVLVPRNAARTAWTGYARFGSLAAGQPIVLRRFDLVDLSDAVVVLVPFEAPDEDDDAWDDPDIYPSSDELDTGDPPPDWSEDPPDEEPFGWNGEHELDGGADGALVGLVAPVRDHVPVTCFENDDGREAADAC